MVEMKNPIKEADAHPEIRHFDFTENKACLCMSDQMRTGNSRRHALSRERRSYLMVLEDECTVRTPHKEFVLKQHDTVMLESKQPNQLCNTGKGGLLLLGAGNAGVNGVPRSRVPDMASHTPVQEPVVA